MFAAAGVDPGTKVLLLEAPRPDADETGHLLDLGCGYGPVALTLARRHPSGDILFETHVALGEGCAASQRRIAANRPGT